MIAVLADDLMRYAKVEELISQGNYVETERLVRSWLASERSAKGYDLLGLSVALQGRLEEAERAYSKALELDPSLSSPAVRIGIVYGKARKFKQCIQVLEPKKKTIREDPEAIFYLCQAYLEERHETKALSLLGHLEKPGADPDALFSVAKLLVSKDLYAEALPLLRKAVALIPDSEEVHYSLAFALFKLQKYEEMWLPLDEALRLNADVPRIHLLYAMGLLDVRRIHRAKEHLQRVRELQPDNGFAGYLWCRALVEEGAYSPAINLLQRLTEQGSQDPEVHFLLVTALRRNGDLQKAADCADRLTRMFPDNAAAHLNAALELQSLGRLSAAEAHLRTALSLADHSSKTLKEAQFSLSSVLTRMGNFSEAGSLLEGIVRANPRDVPARVELGGVWTKAGKLYDAMEILEQAVKLEPKNKRARFLLASVLVRLGRQAEADQHFVVFERLESDEIRSAKDETGVYTKGIR
ncbi:MAG: tetratricopeptide repeat protein [Acidobacteria bacterium]|nr:tetratricopeptide repeat protein [Acidobacteriota bacterium]